jgi:nucleoid-associated protein YgaU
MPTVLTIHMYRAGQLVGSHHFDSRSQRVVKIGRIGSAHLRIDEPDVARVHAVIELTHMQAQLIDMGSQVGTFLNGKRISKAPLKRDDQVVIGSTGLLIGVDTQHDGAALQAAAPAPSPAAPAAVTATPELHPNAEPALQTVATSQPAAAPAPPSPPQEATPNAPRPDVITAQRIGAKIAALSPESQQTVETFIDLLASRPDGITVQVNAGGLDFTTLPGDGAHAPGREDTASMIAVSGIGNRRRVVVVCAAAAAVIALGFLGARIWESRNKPADQAAGVWSLEVDGNGESQANGMGQGAAPNDPADRAPPPAGAPAQPGEPRDPDYVYVRLDEPRSLRDVARALWPAVDRTELLLGANSGASGPEDAEPAGAVVRFPRKTAYRVRPGDSLAAIAEAELGDAHLYPTIYEANRDVLSSPSALEAGMLLQIPLVDDAVKKRLDELGTVQPVE